MTSAAASDRSDADVTIIEPPRGLRRLDLHGLVRHRRLLLVFARRQLRARYAQTVVGVLWALFRPILSVVLLVVVFDRIAGMPTSGASPILFYAAGAVIWAYASTTLGEAVNAFVSYQGMISKVYFPRLLLPIASLLPSLVDFSVGAVIVLVMCAVSGLSFGFTVVTIPAFLALAAGTSLGVGLILAPVNAIYRDIRELVPVLLQTLFFVSPLGYPLAAVPQDWRLAYCLNPYASAIEGFRAAVLGTPMPTSLQLGVSVGACFVLIIVGVAVASRLEGAVVDLA